MGLYDRDYMKATPPPSRRPRPSWTERLRFRLWLFYKALTRKKPR